MDKEIKVVPKTLALIPDGNRRWARKHQLTIPMGYNKGVDRFLEFSKWCMEYGINSITVWMLSIENLSRPKHELSALFSIYKRVASDKKLISELQRTETKVKVIGRKDLLPKDVVASFTRLEEQTKSNKKRVINMLLAYGGRDDIIEATKRVVEKAISKGTAKIEDLFERSLVSYGIPNIDFIIRTSGEQRLSGFIPWQSDYSELYFSKKLWPDFTKEDLKRAIMDYSKRQRRFGK
ncbi:MAG: polyprenyl diphosphate synthase [Candidatus Micrarchaeaceae archaeon]